MLRRARVAKYHYPQARWSYLLWMPHFFLGRQFYRDLDFWRPADWHDWSWRFVGLLAIFVLLWSATLVFLRWVYKTRMLWFEVTPEKMASVQRASSTVGQCITGDPSTMQLSHVALADVAGVQSAGPKWITFDLMDGSQFDLAIGAVWSGKRRRVCDILGAAGFAELHDKSNCQPFRIPRFSIRGLMWFTLFVAVLCAAFRWCMLDLNLDPLQGAMACVGATVGLGLIVVMVGTVWVGITDSKPAHRCVTLGGVTMATSVPVGVIMLVAFGGTRAISTGSIIAKLPFFANAVRTYPALVIVGILTFVAIAFAVVWLLVYFYSVVK